MPKTKKETRANFFTIRVVEKWNELPEEVKAANTVNSFKNKYDQWKRNNNGNNNNH